MQKIISSRWKKIPKRSFESPLGWTSISATDALTMDSFGDYHLAERAVLILSPKGRPVSLQLQDHHGGGYLLVPAMKRTYGVLLKETGSKPLAADKWIFKTPEHKTRPYHQSTLRIFHHKDASRERV